MRAATAFDRCAVQVAAHVTSDAARMHDKAWLEAAADLGVDAIGGVPAISDRERPLDLHMGEHLDADRHLFVQVAG
jgi:hypothetical protein